MTQPYDVKEEKISMGILDVFSVGEDGEVNIVEEVDGNSNYPFMVLSDLIFAYTDRKVVPFGSLKVDMDSEWFRKIYGILTVKEMPDYRDYVVPHKGHLVYVTDLEVDKSQFFFVRGTSTLEIDETIDDYLEKNMVNYRSECLKVDIMTKVDARIVSNFIVNVLKEIIDTERTKRLSETNAQRVLKAINETIRLHK